MKKDEINARNELASVLGRAALLGACLQIVAARFEWLDCGVAEETFTLKARPEGMSHHSHDLWEMDTFLDRQYDAGYGGQLLGGCVWLSDGTWLTRREYDGSEWWERHECPTVPR